MRMTKDQIEGAIYGLALGDAWGYPYEFRTFVEEEGKSDLPDQLIVSDDTQLSLYTLHGVLDAMKETSLDGIAEDIDLQNFVNRNIAYRYMEFFEDEDNNRSPGNTCMESFNNIYYNGESLVTGKEFGIAWSQGNCANMRAPWIALLPLGDRDKEVIGGNQAGITHGHPMAEYATRLTVRAMNILLTDPLDDYASVRLSDKLLETMNNDPDTAEHAELVQQLSKTNDKLNHLMSHENIDVTMGFNRGETAASALVCALAMVDGYGWGGRAEIGLQRLVQGAGDSDTIAAIAGAMMGVIQGPQWVKSVIGSRDFEPRYNSELNMLIETLEDLHIAQE